MKTKTINQLILTGFLLSIAVLLLFSCKKDNKAKPVSPIATNTITDDYSGEYQDSCVMGGSCTTIVVHKFNDSTYTILGINPLLCGLQDGYLYIRDSTIYDGSYFNSSYTYNGQVYSFSSITTLNKGIFNVAYTNDYYLNSSIHTIHHKLTKL